MHSAVLSILAHIRFHLRHWRHELSNSSVVPLDCGLFAVCWPSSSGQHRFRHKSTRQWHDCHIMCPPGMRKLHSKTSCFVPKTYSKYTFHNVTNMQLKLHCFVFSNCNQIIQRRICVLYRSPINCDTIIFINVESTHISLRYKFYRESGEIDMLNRSPKQISFRCRQYSAGHFCPITESIKVYYFRRVIILFESLRGGSGQQMVDFVESFIYKYFFVYERFQSQHRIPFQSVAQTCIEQQIEYLGLYI